MSETPPMLFTAAHGFYQFAVPAETLERSLYYNLLLQPSVAIPDHYLLQGSWLAEHLSHYPSRDSWVEVGLKHDLIRPYLRQGEKSLVTSHESMAQADRRGFHTEARFLAERLDRTRYVARDWDSATNSRGFQLAVERFVRDGSTPSLELPTDPDDFLRFWTSSRSWIDLEFAQAADRSAELLGSDGLLLSQLIQVTGERLLGRNCGRIANIQHLLSQVRTKLGIGAAREVRAYYTFACELYNRTLADTISSSPNSPKWGGYIAAMDMWQEHARLTNSSDSSSIANEPPLDLEIRLPSPTHLRRVSGDALMTLRKSPACERYFESLLHWQSKPDSLHAQHELTATLRRYSEEIRKHVGKEVGTFGFHPQFISQVTDLSRILERTPSVLFGFLATAGMTTAASFGQVSPFVPAGMLTLFCLQTVAKYRVPTRKIGVTASPGSGIKMHIDVTITRST